MRGAVKDLLRQRKAKFELLFPVVLRVYHDGETHHSRTRPQWQQWLVSRWTTWTRPVNWLPTAYNCHGRGLLNVTQARCAALPHQMDNSVRFISWNTKGVHGPVKRSRLVSHLKNLKADVIFRQDTFKNIWSRYIMQHLDWSSISLQFCTKIQLNPINIVSDSNGRYVIITGSLFHIPVLLVNVYAPNKLLASLPNLNPHQLIFGGDLNCVIDPDLDRP